MADSSPSLVALSAQLADHAAALAAAVGGPLTLPAYLDWPGRPTA
ncbi:hypothetical protein [Streptomyces sp. NPDC059928]